MWRFSPAYSFIIFGLGQRQRRYVTIASMRLIIALILLCLPLSALCEPINWQRIGEDLEEISIPLSSTPFFSSELVLLRTSLKRYRLGVLRATDFGKKRMSVKSLIEQSGALGGINANFFDEQHMPLGLVVDRGIILQELHRGGSLLNGIFEVNRGTIRIIDREDFLHSSATEAVQAGPIIIKKGEIQQNIKGASSFARRSGVCIDRDSRLILFCLKATLGGVSLAKLQKILLAPEVACVDALNFDGGGSAQLFLDKEVPGAISDFAGISILGRDEVPVVLAVYPK